MDRSHQIEGIFHEALQHEPAKREAFVREACRGDSDLRCEVVSLLANHEDGTALDASLPRELFTLPTGIPSPNIYEAAPDGQRFLAGDIAAGPEPLNVILNWPALMKKGSAVQ